MSTSSGPGSSPLVQRRRLRTELRRARGEIRLTQEQVAIAMDWSLSKVIRIENGMVGISTNDLRVLLSLYEINDTSRINELIELAKAARQTSWWGKYRDDISPQYFQFIEYEEAASIVRAYEPMLIPGLLQTPEYAEAVMRALAPPELPTEVIRTRVEIRLRRQQLLEQAEPPTLICAIGESAVRYLLSERDIAQAQVAMLIEMANRPNITVEIVPFSAGVRRGMDESFAILEFPDPEDSDVFFSEGPGQRDMIISRDESGEMATYREVLEGLRAVSLGKAGTLAFLRNLAE
jgi:transcriptional regulator with XRE-family HTH domain